MRFLVLKYPKRHFPCLYCLKKELGKLVVFGQKPWVNPFLKNVNFSTFWTSLFHSLEKRLFVLQYRIRHFPGLYCQKKKKLEKWQFWTKTMALPLWKNVNFWPFSTSCFYSLERRLFVLEYRKRHFPGLYCQK